MRAMRELSRCECCLLPVFILLIIAVIVVATLLATGTIGVLSQVQQDTNTDKFIVKENVRFKTENAGWDHMYGSLCGDPTASDKGLIVIHEGLGMTSELQDRACHLARQKPGFVTLVPDLYRGDIAQNFQEQLVIMGGLSWEGAIKDIQGAALYLKARGIKKVGVTGFCLGGALSLATAALTPLQDIAAYAPFYGIPNPDVCGCNISLIQAPVEGHYAINDSLITPQRVKTEVEDVLNAANVNYKIHQYNNAGHAFNRINGTSYNKEAHDLSFKRLIEFMTKHLT